MNIQDDIINHDSQGWPVYRMNLQEILISLGGEEIGDKIVFNSNSPEMMTYPIVVTDDGMGYGVDDNYIVSADIYKTDSETFVTLFRERDVIHEK